MIYTGLSLFLLHLSRRRQRFSLPKLSFFCLGPISVQSKIRVPGFPFPVGQSRSSPPGPDQCAASFPVAEAIRFSVQGLAAAAVFVSCNAQASAGLFYRWDFSFPFRARQSTERGRSVDSCPSHRDSRAERTTLTISSVVRSSVSRSRSCFPSLRAECTADFLQGVLGPIVLVFGSSDSAVAVLRIILGRPVDKIFFS
jgi:hypothetical protein